MVAITTIPKRIHEQCRLCLVTIVLSEGANLATCDKIRERLEWSEPKKVQTTKRVNVVIPLPTSESTNWNYKIACVWQQRYVGGQACNQHVHTHTPCLPRMRVNTVMWLLGITGWKIKNMSGSKIFFVGFQCDKRACVNTLMVLFTRIMCNAFWGYGRTHALRGTQWPHVCILAILLVLGQTMLIALWELLMYTCS